MVFLRFNKQVHLVNPQLAAVHFMLSVLAFIYFVHNFITDREYYEIVDMGPFISVSLEEGLRNHSSLEQTSQHESRFAAHCLESYKYEYWPRGSPDKWANLTCMPLCPMDRFAWTCLPTSERERWLGDSEILFVTSIRDTFSRPRNSSFDMSSTPRTANYFATAAHKGVIKISYMYDVMKTDKLAIRDYHSRVQASSLGVDDMLPLTTVLLDSEGKVHQVYEPGTEISLSLEEILVLAGVGQLDRENKYSAPNDKPGSNARPALRLVGGQLSAVIGCYESHVLHLPNVKEVEHLPRGSVCSLDFRLRPTGAGQTSRLVDDVYGGQLQRIYFGVQIDTATEGEYDSWDFNKIVLNITSLIVIMQLPQAAVTFIAKYMLGHLSKLYKRAIVEEFDIPTEVAGVTMRLMAASTSFVHLQDEAGADLVSGISFHRVQERMLRIMADQEELSEAEIQSLGEFCFGLVVAREHAARSSLCACLQPGARTPPPNVKTGTGKNVDASEIRIGEPDFCSAYCSSDSISYHHLHRLFDKDRTLGPLERLFTPAPVWRAVHRPRREGKAPVLARSNTPKSLEEQKADSHLIVGRCNERLSRAEASDREVQTLKRHMEALEERLAYSETMLRRLADKYLTKAHSTDGSEEALVQFDSRLQAMEESLSQLAAIAPSKAVAESSALHGAESSCHMSTQLTHGDSKSPSALESVKGSCDLPTNPACSDLRSSSGPEEEVGGAHTDIEADPIPASESVSGPANFQCEPFTLVLEKRVTALERQHESISEELAVLKWWYHMRDYEDGRTHDTSGEGRIGDTRISSSSKYVQTRCHLRHVADARQSVPAFAVSSLERRASLSSGREGDGQVSSSAYPLVTEKRKQTPRPERKVWI